MKTILAVLTAFITLITPATAQLKGLSISGAGKTVSTSGEVVASADEIRTAAAILRAEIVVQAGDDRYGDLPARNKKGLEALRVADTKSLEQLLPALAESLERVASGIGVEYPEEKELRALQTAVGKIRVDGPTGQTTEGQIIWAYGIAKAMLRKELKCSNPAVSPTTPTPATPAPATPPVPATPPGPADPTKVELPSAPIAVAPGAAPAPTVPAPVATPAPAPAPATPAAPAPAIPAVPAKIKVKTAGGSAADGLRPPAKPAGAP